MRKTPHGLGYALKFFAVAAMLAVIALAMASLPIFSDANALGVAMFLAFILGIPACALCVLGLLGLVTRAPHSEEAVTASHLKSNQVPGERPNCEAVIPLSAAECPCCGAFFCEHSSWKVREHMGYLITAVLALFAATSSAFAYIGPPELEVGVKECVGQNLNTFLCARGIEEKLLLGRRFPVKRAGNTLIIRTATKTVRLIDNISENGNESIAYSYLGRISAIRSHIVYVQYHEGGSYMVVNEQSAQAAYPSGFPVVSPNKQHFFSISEDMFAGYIPNNVEVWHVSAKVFHRVANFEPEWGPRSATWLDSRHFEVSKVCHAPTEEDAAELKPCGKARVLHSNAAWKLIE